MKHYVHVMQQVHRKRSFQRFSTLVEPFVVGVDLLIGVAPGVNTTSFII